MDTMHVKKGCLDCLYKETPLSKKPCSGCTRWSKWVDKSSAAEQKKEKT